MGFVILSVIGLVLSGVITWALRCGAMHWNIVDVPGTGIQKIHTTPTPLLGGVAPLLAWSVIVWGAWICGWGGLRDVPLLHLLGITVGILLVILWGVVDDVYNLSPRMQSAGALLAALAPVVGGVSLTTITNPFGGIIRFDGYGLGGMLIAGVIVFGFVFGAMHVTKVLDGLDGLVSGIAVIGMAVIGSIALSQPWYQPQVATMALIGCGVWMGVLLWNRHPARIFLGNAGSYGAGYMLACLAVLSSSKIATVLLVLAVPIMDLLVVMVRRVFVQKRSPFLADKTHIHHRLLALGISHARVVWVLWFLSVAGGVCAILLPAPLRYIVLAMVLFVSALCLASLRVQ